MALQISKLFSVQGRRAVVTGGGRGIGRMIAQAFIDNGAHVYITSRSAKSCERAAEEMSSSEFAKSTGGRCVALPFDLSNEKGCLDFAEALSQREEALEILVNNSGTSWGAPLEEYPDQAWDKLFSLNVKTVFSLTRALLPLLDKGASKGDPARVINVGSIAGLSPQPIPTYAYDASKAAVHMLTRKLASELSDRGDGKSITVNAIAPGFVPSRMSAQLLTYADEAAIRSAIPLGRLGSPEDMGGAALYLASRAGAWTTGAILTVDGGTLSQPFSMMPKL